MKTPVVEGYQVLAESPTKWVLRRHQCGFAGSSEPMAPVPVEYEVAVVDGGLLVPKNVPDAKLLSKRLRSSHWRSMILPVERVQEKIVSTRFWLLQERVGG